MGITNAFQIGRSALTAAQLGVQVTGNNLANATTPGYSREIIDLRPAVGRDEPGGRIGSGVRVANVRRALDEAVQARLNDAVSRQAAAEQRLDVFSQLEATLGELTDQDVGSQLTSFFNAWSEVANLSGSEVLVVQQGEQLAQNVQRLRDELIAQRSQIDRQLDAVVARADDLLGEIGGLNEAIANAEIGDSSANALRDERDRLIGELSEIIDATAVEQPSGMVNVLVGSTPVLLGTQSRGLEVDRRTMDGELTVQVRVAADEQPLAVNTGRAGALLEARQTATQATVEKLDEIASQLIFEVNKLHSTGRGATGLASATGSLRFTGADQSLALNDPANQTIAGLPFEPANGGFDVMVTNDVSGETQTVRIDVDLDGLDANLEPGFADDTSAEDIRAALDAIDGLSATFTADGRLQVDAAPGVEFSFRDDSSQALAVLGMNAFFTGTNATDIAVRDDLVAKPQALATARYEGDTLVANGTALAMAGLIEQTVEDLGGLSLTESWDAHAQTIGGRTASALVEADSTRLVRENLEGQRAALSGVSTDEEALNLVNFQRSYDGAARFLSVVDEMTQTLLSLV